MTKTSQTTTAPHQARPKRPSHLKATIGMIVLAGFLVWAIWAANARWERIPDFFTELPNYIQLMGQGVASNPFEGTVSEYWSNSFGLMMESLYMAWMGTVIGALLSFPLGFLAASNVAPRPVVFVVRQFLNMIRAIPDLILAIAIMLPIFGLGPLAGAMALGVGSTGTLGKLTSEAIEGVHRGPVESVQASGARKSQVLRWGVLPQVLPEIISFWLYRFEINIRASAILGVLGAGGIGALLSRLFQARMWERIGITLIVIIIVTILVDQISARVRDRVINGPRNAKAAESQGTGTEPAGEGSRVGAIV